MKRRQTDEEREFLGAVAISSLIVAAVLLLFALLSGCSLLRRDIPWCPEPPDLDVIEGTCFDRQTGDRLPPYCCEILTPRPAPR